MSGQTLSWGELKERSYSQKPHLVILGAGASRAAFPDGDANGAVLPLMNNLIGVLGLTSVIEQEGYDFTGNFEDVYSVIAANPKHNALRVYIEHRVSEYFSSLRLPEYPTIYDYLVLSLREKDIIATFNWDPFLYLACCRNHHVASMPRCLYLHGCAVIGYCLEHKSQGFIDSSCTVCGNPFTPGPLLFPVAHKDYITNPYIKAQWNSFQAALHNAYIVTIFGYGAPSSDAGAVELMNQAWGGSDMRNFEEIEIINVLPREELTATWSRFIHTHHYQTTDSYFSSLLGYFPRRTCEAMWEQLMKVKFLESSSVPRFDVLVDLQEWASEIRSFERV